MPTSPAPTLARAFAQRYSGALVADPYTLVVIYQEAATINFLIMALLAPAPIVAATNGAAAVLMAALWRWSTSWPIPLRTWVSMALIFAVITVSIWVYGGINSIFMVWYLVIPVPLMLIMGTRAMVWSFVVIGALAALTLVLQQAGWLAGLPSPGTQMHLPLATMAMMVLTIFSMPMISYWVLQQVLARQRQRNHELRRTQASLLQQRRQQDEFVASVSHELRTPMNAIMGFLQAMDPEHMRSARNREMFGAMNQSAKHLLTVINDLLDFSQIQSGDLRVTPRPMSLHALLKDVATMFDTPLKERGIPLRLHIAADLPDWIDGDADRITQVIINLLGNAAKFTRQGHITLRATVAAYDRLRVEVQDTGCGIAAQQLQTVFERFSHVSDHTRREYGGTGLGLSISQNLVHAMGGEIDVASVVDEGSTFWFELPVQRCTEPRHHSPTVKSSQAAPTAAGCVLIVDDSPINCVVARQMLHADLPTLQVLEASSGAQALEITAHQTVDVVLMDVIMPGMDGLETTRRMRAQAASAPVIIGLTADISESVHQSCLEAGMVRVLTKPYSRADLFAQVSAAMRQRGSQHAAT